MNYWKKHKTLIITTSVCLVLALAGGSLGYFLGKRFFVSSVDYSNIDPNSLEDNNTLIYQQFDSYQNQDKTQDEYIDNFTPYQLANAAFYQSGKETYSKVVGNGQVIAGGAKQKIMSYHIKKGSDYFFESISTGLMSVAKRFYQNDEVKWYRGKVDKSGIVAWNASSEVINTVEDFTTSWGKDLSRQTVYIISSKTALETSTISKDGDHLIISLDLDPILSAVRYVKQMVMMSALEANPVFKSINFTMTLDSNFRIIEAIATESYRVKKFGWNDATGYLKETTSYQVDEDIPDINTGIVYE
ncbi:MAG: hypothetical protein WC201_01115 [Bacilli bacterium]